MAKGTTLAAIVKSAGAAALAAAACVSSPAAAQSHLIAVGPMVSSLVASMKCEASAPQAAAVLTSKSAAILGGEMSALERMKMQQSQPVADSSANIDETLSSDNLALSINCLSPNARTGMFEFQPSATVRDASDFLATKRVKIAATSFDKDWRRVTRNSFSAAGQSKKLGLPSDRQELVSNVNRLVNRQITYVEDIVLFGRSDYWAEAALTFRLGKGDCEDIAIAKMDMLLANGIPAEEMFLTIARDQVRNADHALLMVKVDGRFVGLDNSTDILLDGAVSNDYRPVLSFNSESAWLHGV